MPTQDITWTVPEGGGGPKYSMCFSLPSFYCLTAIRYHLAYVCDILILDTTFAMSLVAGISSNYENIEPCLFVRSLWRLNPSLKRHPKSWMEL